MKQTIEKMIQELEKEIGLLEKKSFLFAQIEPDVIPNQFDTQIDILKRVLEMIENEKI